MARCKFEDGKYQIEQLEQLRRRTLTSSVAQHARLIIIEELQPSVMEILGRTCRLPAYLFKRHVGKSWGGENDALGSAIDPRTNVQDSSLLIAIPQPILLSLWYANDQSTTSDITLREAAAFLQEKRVWPLVHQSSVGRTYSVAFKHTTLYFDYSTSGSWQG